MRRAATILMVLAVGAAASARAPSPTARKMDKVESIALELRDDIIHGDAGLDDALVALAALEADRARRVVGSIEIGGVGDHGGQEVRHLSGGTLLGRDRTLGVEVVGEVDHVHGRECLWER